MPLLKLTVADLPRDDHTSPTRPTWINTDHVETATAHVTWHELDAVLWLELAMTSGAVHYALIGPLTDAEPDTAADHAIDRILRRGAHLAAVAATS